MGQCLIIRKPKYKIPIFQSKTISPTETEQTITPDSGYDGLSRVTVGAISSTYVGSSVNRVGAKTITPNTSTQTAVAANTYVTGAITVNPIPSNYINIDTNTVNAPTPTINVSASGLITASVNNPKGYQASATTKSATNQLTTKGAATYTPRTIDQTIASDQYLTGVQTIKGDANLLAENIASGITIFGITGTHSGGSGIDTSDATATAADIVNGQTAYVNGVKLTGTLVVQNYYTGTVTPDSSIGEDGDLYFKV